MAISKTDKIFWLRAGLGAIAGVLADALFGADDLSAILFVVLVYLASYYLVRNVWGSQFKEDEMNKLYTAGIGSFVLLFIFFYIFLFTFGFHYLTL
ncbi:MAG: hypothetical protein ABSF83_13745 [Nitrososphaerales archaeon]|jgi:4-amino-4-deoxy-L-arabinose transferase-like glycosyltransferase